MSHNELFDLGLAVSAGLKKLLKNCVDSIKKLGVALGYADSVLLLNGCILSIGLTCIVEGNALKVCILGNDVLSGKLVDDNAVNLL